MSELHNNDVGWSALPEALGRHGRGCCEAGFLLPDAALRTAPDSFEDVVLDRLAKIEKGEMA